MRAGRRLRVAPGEPGRVRAEDGTEPVLIVTGRWFVGLRLGLEEHALSMGKAGDSSLSPAR